MHSGELSSDSPDGTPAIICKRLRQSDHASPVRPILYLINFASRLIVHRCQMKKRLLLDSLNRLRNTIATEQTTQSNTSTLQATIGVVGCVVKYQRAYVFVHHVCFAAALRVTAALTGQHKTPGHIARACAPTNTATATDPLQLKQVETSARDRSWRSI